MNTTILAHQIAARIPELARDSTENAATVISGMIQNELRRRDDTKIVNRLNDYLQSGGLFNPEHMEHDKVRDLIIDTRNHLTQ